MRIRHLALAAAILCAPAHFNPLLAQDEKPKKNAQLVESGEADVEARAPGVAMSAGKINGAKVRSKDGAELGDISEVVVERRTGRIKVALVSVGGFLGIGDKLVAVPWSVLSPAGTDEPSFILDATKGELETAPGVESGAITNASYRDWLMWGEQYFGKDRKRPATSEPASEEKKPRVKKEKKEEAEKPMPEEKKPRVKKEKKEAEMPEEETAP